MPMMDSWNSVIASWTETLPDWIDAHVQAFAYFGGAPRLIVPDNPKVAVIRACFYDPQVNRTYAEMAAHYDTAVLPARPRRPRDKAKVEAMVRIVERWLLGTLRHRRFYILRWRRGSRVSRRLWQRHLGELFQLGLQPQAVGQAGRGYERERVRRPAQRAGGVLRRHVRAAGG